MDRMGEFLNHRFRFAAGGRQLTRSARNAIAALQKRLSHRNPNVQLYALEVRLRDFHGIQIADIYSSPTPWLRTVGNP